MFILLAALTHGAPPQTVQTVDTYNCGASRGHYDKRPLPGRSGLTEIRGVIIPIEPEDSKSKWLPAAGVVFQPEDGKGSVGLQLWRLDKTSDYQYGIRVLGAQSDTPKMLGKLDPSRPIRFMISLDRAGTLNVRVNDEAYVVRGFTLPPRNPVAMCSGGSFRFEQITVSGQD